MPRRRAVLLLAAAAAASTAAIGLFPDTERLPTSHHRSQGGGEQAFIQLPAASPAIPRRVPAAAATPAAEASPATAGGAIAAASLLASLAAVGLRVPRAAARAQPAPRAKRVVVAAAADKEASEKDEAADENAAEEAKKTGGDDEYIGELEDDYDDMDEDEDDQPYNAMEAPKVEAFCRARGLKGSPYKFRRVLWQIAGRSYREALMLLEFMPWRACKPTLKALQSAAANAQNHFNMDKSRLYISQCKAEKGQYMKRMRRASKGQMHPYVRKTTHLTIAVAEMDDD